MKKTYFPLIFILYMLWAIASNIIHPITTDYVHSLALPTSYFGFFFSLMSLGQVVGAIFWGYLSDKIGRKLLLCIGTIGYGVFQLCFGFINQWPILILLFRILGGFFASAPVTLFITFAIDNLSLDKRVKGLSFLISFKFLGESLGYYLGGALYSYFQMSFQQVFIFQASLCLFTAIASYIFLGKEKKEKVNNTNKLSSLKNINQLGLINTVFLISVLLIAMGQININKYFDVYFIDLGYNAGQLGLYCLLTGIIGCLGNLLLVPLFKNENKIKIEFVLPLFILMQIITTLITFNSPTSLFIPFICSFHLLYTICKVSTLSLQQAYISKVSKKENHGLIIGVMQSILSLGNVLAPLIGSAIYKSKEVLIFNIAALLLGGGFIILIIIFIIKSKKKQIN